IRRAFRAGDAAPAPIRRTSGASQLGTVHAFFVARGVAGVLRRAPHGRTLSVDLAQRLSTQSPEQPLTFARTRRPNLPTLAADENQPQFHPHDPPFGLRPRVMEDVYDVRSPSNPDPRGFPQRDA